MANASQGALRSEKPSPTSEKPPSNRGKDGGASKFAPPRLTPPRINRDIKDRHSPWLLIRDAAGDTGARPLAGGTVFWESPDVWVVSSLGINQPVVGKPNDVFARVTNLGRQYATGVEVLFWWANPSLAITEATATPIGVGHADIPSGWSVIVKCDRPWIPVEENGGHECLIAEAFVRKFDPLTAPMDPVEDRHVGQKNEQLVQLGAGQSFKIGVRAANMFNLAQTLTFEVHDVRVKSLHPLVTARKLSQHTGLHAPTAALPLSLEFNSAAPVFVGPSALFASRFSSMARQHVAGGLETLSTPVQIARSVAFQPWETRIVEISGQVPPGAKVGETFAFRIVQRVGAMIMGGYTVNVVVIGR